MSRAYSLLSVIIPHDEQELAPQLEEDSEEKVEEPSEAELKIREGFGEYGPKCARKVLKALNNVYEPRATIRRAVHKIEDALVDILLKYEINQSPMEKLFMNHDNRSPARYRPPQSREEPKVMRVKKEAESFDSDDLKDKDHQGEQRLADDPPSDQDCPLGNKKSRRRITGKSADELGRSYMRTRSRPHISHG